MAAFTEHPANTTTPRFLETDCVGGCTRPYRIDEYHSDYARVKAALEAGDRSILRCYHGPVVDESSRKRTLRDSPAAKRKP